MEVLVWLGWSGKAPCMELELFGPPSFLWLPDHGSAWKDLPTLLCLLCFWEPFSESDACAEGTRGSVQGKDQKAFVKEVVIEVGFEGWVGVQQKGM